MKEYLETAGEAEKNGYLLRLGIDHFKEINENYGEEYGNFVLQETASCISGCLSQNQKVYKLMSDEFIPILEESGLIIPAGRFMIREGMETCAKIRKEIADFKVSINISQVQAAKSDVIKDILSEMKKTGLPSDALIIELTESDLLEENINEMHFLTELKRNGIKLALDDFGTGYSNFHYLSTLAPEIIKIDRSFTASAVADSGEYYLLEQFCNMVYSLGLLLCVEGVENEEEWTKIRQLGSEYSQGFFWGKPCGYEEFVRQFVEMKK